MISLIFANGKTLMSRLAGRVIWAFDGGDATHVAVCANGQIIDATAWHGVARWDRASWIDRYDIVDEVQIPVRSIGAEDQAIVNAMDRVGQRYDFLELLGFVLLRDLGDPDRPVCSRLGYDVWLDATGYALPDRRRGRVGPRLLRTHIAGYVAGRMSK